MKKLSLVAIATVLAAPAFADQVAVPVGINTSVSQGVNVGSVTNLGLNNVGVVNQNVAVGGGVHLETNSFNQRFADFNMDTHAFSVGSIVDSGNGGEGGNVDVIAGERCGCGVRKRRSPGRPRWRPRDPGRSRRSGHCAPGRSNRQHRTG
jgi:hypothetical protein